MKRTDSDFASNLSQIRQLHGLLWDFLIYLSLADCLLPTLKNYETRETTIREFLLTKIPTQD
jgi:hypothetical protein